MLVFVENIGHKCDFQWGGVVSGRVLGGGGGPYAKKKRLLKHISNVDG